MSTSKLSGPKIFKTKAAFIKAISKIDGDFMMSLSGADIANSALPMKDDCSWTQKSGDFTQHGKCR